jgi:hypothetical protein
MKKNISIIATGYYKSDNWNWCYTSYVVTDGKTFTTVKSNFGSIETLANILNARVYTGSYGKLKASDIKYMLDAGSAETIAIIKRDFNIK